MSNKKYRPSDVHFFEATYHPVATCLGIRIESDDPQGFDQLVHCEWTRQASQGYGFAPQPAEVKKQAKNHAMLHPGHVVHVERLTRASYYINLSDEELDALVEAKKPHPEATS